MMDSVNTRAAKRPRADIAIAGTYHHFAASVAPRAPGDAPLSDRRAEAVETALLDRGIAGDRRMIANGHPMPR